MSFLDTCSTEGCNNKQDFKKLKLCVECFEDRFLNLESSIFELQGLVLFDDAAKELDKKPKDGPKTIDKSKVWVDSEYNLMWELISDRVLYKTYDFENAIEYVKLLNQIKYAGYDDWRLPTEIELSLLVDEDASSMVDVATIEELSYNTNDKHKQYWTSTEIQDEVVVIDFDDGSTYAENKQNINSVRCVRNL